MTTMRRSVLALGLAAVLAACGGGGSDTSTRAQITAVHVFGDSLADVGSMAPGAVRDKATVQAANSYLYPELVAQAFGISSMCSLYQGADPTTVTYTPQAGCTDHAVSGGRIHDVAAPTSGRSIVQQLVTAAAGTYSADDLVLIDGGGNDAADLFGAYVRAAGDGGAAYSGLLSSLLNPADVAAALPTATGRATIGGQYMVALADKFHTAIVTHVLTRGATRVALLNMPAIDKTPRFQLVLNSIAASAAAAATAGGATPEQAAAAGAATRAQVGALASGWIQAFNARLAANFAGETRVTVVDFFQGFEDQFANPVQFGLTNVVTPACPITGVGGDGLPTYTFSTCTATALSASPPSGVTDPEWWQRYAFADGFHPTPYTHRLIYQLVSKSLAQKGWL